MKTSYISQLLFLAASILTVNLVQARAYDYLEREISDFETRLISSLEYTTDNSTIKLIGYKNIYIPDEQLEDFEAHYYDNLDIWRSFTHHHYDRPDRTLRVYFPVKDALVQHHDIILEANDLGELPVSEIGGDCSVLGRKQTDSVTGVEGNIIKDGIIYLSTPNKPHHRLSNVLVYDFGEKLVHSHDKELKIKTRDGQTVDIRSVACIHNHGGPNCSDKLDIHKGRCTENHNVCMDYNGLFTDCVKGTEGSVEQIKNFPGSDCDFALNAGYCWNEIM